MALLNGAWRRRALLASPSIAVACLLACKDEPLNALVIGHRGAPNEELENSIASFARARDLGADGVELDVQLTADRQLVVMHDPTLDRTTSCTGSVHERTLDELSMCSLRNGEPIRTLSEVLSTIGPWFSIVFVEIKVDEPTFKVERADEAARIVGSLDPAKVVIISYDDDVLARLAAQRVHGIHVGWDDTSNLAITSAARLGLDWVLLRIDAVEGREGILARGLGKRTCVYGIGTPEQFLTATRAGIDVLMTDSIRTVSSLLGRRPIPGDAAAVTSLEASVD